MILAKIDIEAITSSTLLISAINFGLILIISILVYHMHDTMKVIMFELNTMQNNLDNMWKRIKRIDNRQRRIEKALELLQPEMKEEKEDGILELLDK